MEKTKFNTCLNLSKLTEVEINKAWGYADFGGQDKLDVIIETLKKVAQSWSFGKTALHIVTELGLVEERNNSLGLTDRGLAILLSYSQRQEGSNVPDNNVGDITKPTYEELAEALGLMCMDLEERGRTYGDAYKIGKQILEKIK